MGITGRFAEQILDLRVDTAEIIRRPFFQYLVELSADPEQKTFLLRHQYSVPVLSTGVASCSETSATSRLFVIAALRSSSSATIFC